MSRLRTLDHFRSHRRVAVVGPAGSGKSILAIEKARRLARDGFRTLLVCFNQPLATAVLREVERGRRPTIRRRPERLTVSTFHRLCETLGERAGVLPPKPDDPPREWWDDVLPGSARRRDRRASRRAVPRDRRRRGAGLRACLARVADVPARGSDRRRPVGLPRPRPGALPGRPGRPRSASSRSSCSRTTAARRRSASSPPASTAARPNRLRWLPPAARRGSSRPRPGSRRSRPSASSSTG